MDSTAADKGLQPEKFNSDVTLSDVCFSYPFRPNVQVSFYHVFTIYLQ